MGIYDRDYYRRETRGSLWISGRAPVTLALVVINVLVSLALLPWAFDLRGGLLDGVFELVPQKAFYEFQVWRLLTATFCHAGLWHLLGNMLFLWWFGREVEMLYGSREFLGFYLIAAIFSSTCWALVTLVTRPDAPVAMVGASGAVTAVVVLYTLYYPRHTIWLYGFIPVEMRWMVILYLGVDFYGMFGPGYSPVAHVAHLAGAAYGLGYKIFDLRLARFGWPRTRRPRLRVVTREAEPPIEPACGPLDESLEHRMDEVLAKIARDGPASLSSEERQILEEASRRLRDRRG